MKKATIALISFMSFFGVSGVAIQVSGSEPVLEQSESEMTEKNYQDEIMSNPEMSGAARAGTVSAGGNTAIINQSGSSNRSSVVQKGDDNVADQTQTGEYNELRVEQNGRHNRSYEHQTGDHNRKVKIQNGSETIIEQVTP